MLLTAGQTHEMRVAEELLSGIHNAYVIGDSAYSAKALVDSLVARGCTVVIPANPTHPQRDYDAHVYKDRHLMENFFQRIKRFRRIAMRFEKLARNFLAFLLRGLATLKASSTARVVVDAGRCVCRSRRRGRERHPCR